MDITEGIIDLLKGHDNEDKASSGMHWPNEDVSGWDVPNAADDEELDEEEMKKEALGLTDIPAGIVGGEVLGSPGVPQPPGLNRELGDDEETDLFGAGELIEPSADLPPKNEKYKEDDFIENLFGEKVSYLNYVIDLKKTFSKLGMNKMADKVLGVVKNAQQQSMDDVITRYHQSRQALDAAATAGTIKLDYDTGYLTGEVSFLFNNGVWWYDHGVLTSPKRVSDIASGKEDPTLWGNWAWSPDSGMTQDYMELIQGLALKSRDAAAGIIYLYDSMKTRTGTIDASFPAEIPATFYTNYEAAKDLVGATSLVDLESKIKRLSEPTQESKPAPSVESVDSQSPVAKAEKASWETHPAKLQILQEPWEQYATAHGLDSSLDGFIEWHEANYSKLGIGSKSKTLAFLTDAASAPPAPGEKSSTTLPEPASNELPIAAPIRDETRRKQKPEPENGTPVEKVLEKTIREILEGRALGRLSDNKMERYLERVGGSKDDLKPLIDQIIMQTRPAELIEMLEDPEKKYRAVLRQARKATRRVLLGE